MAKIINLSPDFLPRVGTKIELSEDQHPDSNKKIYLNGDIETKNSVTANYLENEKLICYFIIKKDEDDDSILVLTSVM